MKTKTHILNCLVLLLITTLSCKKDEIKVGSTSSISSLAWQESDCYTTLPPPAPSPNGYTEYEEEGDNFKFPCFNPMNSSEIIYQSILYDSLANPFYTEFKIMKYNIYTHTKTLLLSNLLMNSQPSWNKNGWIAFESVGNNIYIMKDDGSNLIQFSDPLSDNYEPVWLNGGDTLIWLNENSDTGENRILTKHINQEVADTLFNGGFNSMTISKDNILLSAGGDYFYTLDLNQPPPYDAADVYEYQTSMPGYSTGLMWSPDGTKFYASKNASLQESGLFEVDFVTGSYRKITQYCGTGRYRLITHSPGVNLLAVEKIESYRKQDQNGNYLPIVVENYSIWLVNLLNNQEAKLMLD